MFKKTLLLLGLPILMFASAAEATMRCGTALISLGDTVGVVREKCGEPDRSVEHQPAVRSNGVPRFNAVKVTLWVYGPRNGASQHLKFIEEKLVAIDTRRD
ncbi:DUF2845 domain-containing protein [Pseudomonas sp. LP_7_YM]|uniref:DUF2845 domain-containing protein n=1 Tax=Pseudomonas sp. LP_7_YM TaxID=2485137 RepID=UPI00105D44AF|nr:DUF2845 domain-containing protein [Pseudomonas sp. LP_7_YM]TDV64425.1 uncharacterized protein DUF2845 [Pseudomonas sp. LP_7_YM]